MRSRYFLTRDTGKNIRYYKLELFKTLFSDFVVERVYGNIRYSGPTGVRKNYFKDDKSAFSFLEKKLYEKRRRGYRNVTFTD